MCRLPGPLVGPNRLFFLEIQCNDSIPTAPTAYYFSYPPKNHASMGFGEEQKMSHLSVVYARANRVMGENSSEVCVPT